MAGVSAPGSDGRVVYAGASRGSVYALDGATGAQLWRGQFLPESAAIAFSPIVSEGVVHAEFNIQVNGPPFDSGGVVALDAATGATRWIHYFARTSTLKDPRGILPVALSGTLLFAPSDDGILYALERETGAVVWQTPSLGTRRYVAASGPRVIVGANSGLLIAYEATSGQELWRVMNDGTIGDVSMDRETVFASVGGSSLTAFEGATGSTRWRVGLVQGSPSLVSVRSAGAVDSDRVYAGASNGYYALRK